MYKKNNMKIKGKTLIHYIPLIFIVIYLIGTIILFKFGPWNWPVKNEVKLYSFLFLMIIGIIIGYSIGIRSKHKVRIKITKKQISLFLLIYIIFLPITSFSRIKTILPSFDVKTLINSLGENYYTNNLINNNVIIEYARIILSPILLATPILVLTSEIKKRRVKIATLVLCGISYVFIDINRGQNRQIIDYIIIVFLGILINESRKKVNKIYNGEAKHSKRFVYIFVLIVLFAMFIIIFGNSMKQRNSSLYNPHAGIYLNSDNIFLKILPNENIKVTVGKLISYLTQGYYGLSIALEQTFNCSMGFGYSTFLLGNIEKLFNVDILSKTYYAKTALYGWPSGETWSSAFVYFASDITFLGTIILFSVLAYILAKTWKEAIFKKINISVVVFYVVFMIFIYSPANNQMFQLGENFVFSWFWLIIWTISPIILKISSNIK